MEGGHLHTLRLFMIQLILIVHQLVSIGCISTIIVGESTGALLYHVRKFEPIWKPLHKTSFGPKESYPF